ncbi:MAG TPA: hypothetical protein VIK55_00965 [Paludibacter sp.]
MSNWFNGSSLQGLYVLGSYSLREENNFSDVDLFGLVKESLTVNQISVLRNELRSELKNTIPSDKLGFRVRTHQELPSFQSKLKSWGYDILNSQNLFGVDLCSLLTPTNTTSFKPQLVFDNVIEILWYNILCLNYKVNPQERNYVCSKSILDITNFILYFNGIFLSTATERIDYIKKNKRLIENFSITLDDLDESLRNRNSPDSYQSKVDFDFIRNRILHEVFLQFFPAFEKFENEFEDFNYWSYDSTIFNFPNEIVNAKIKNSSSNYQNQNFTWRIALIKLLFEIDSIRFLNPEIQFSKTQEALKPFFKSNSCLFKDSLGISSLEILLKIEELRIDSSKLGIDNSRKFFHN